MKYSIILFLFSVFFYNTSHSQTLKGHVMSADEDGGMTSLPGANIVWLNSTSGTTTKDDGSFILETDIKSGIYEYKEDGSIEYIKPGYSVVDFENDNQFIVFCKFQKGHEIARGKRILKIIKKGRSMAEDGDLDEANQQFIEHIKQHFQVNL